MNEMSLPRQSELDRLMAEMQDYGSEFAKTYANHAPMVLVALNNIGGSPARLRDFFTHYRDVKQLFPFVPEVAPVDRASWEGCIGQRDREADLRKFFQAEIAERGVEATLKAYLPRLSPGVAASAFHALMRLAYGLMRMDKVEIAAALAYWTATYFEMPRETGAAPVTDDPAEVLVRVSKIEPLHTLPIEELLWHNMRAVGKVPEFAPVIDWLAIGPDAVPKMAAASLALFAGTMDFCALHAVTGMHWLRIVLPYCPTPAVMLRAFWQGIAALMGEMKFPAIPTAEELEAWRKIPTPDWPEIKAAAALSYDEHDLSLVFSASEEEKVYPDPLYRLVAARRVNLLPFP